MEVDLRCRGGAERCWNEEAIRAYADGVSGREAEVKANNPDVIVEQGRIACQGCVVNQWGNGTLCTANLQPTLYRVRGEEFPRVDDAIVSISHHVLGYEMVKPGSGRMAKGYVAPEVEESPIGEAVLVAVGHPSTTKRRWGVLGRK